MNYDKILAELRAERQRLDHVIASLEELARTTTPIAAIGLPKRRGRRSMPASERQQVSERMKKYWANRRKAKGARA